MWTECKHSRVHTTVRDNIRGSESVIRLHTRMPVLGKAEIAGKVIGEQVHQVQVVDIQIQHVQTNVQGHPIGFLG